MEELLTSAEKEESDNNYRYVELSLVPQKRCVVPEDISLDEIQIGAEGRIR